MVVTIFVYCGTVQQKYLTCFMPRKSRLLEEGFTIAAWVIIGTVKSTMKDRGTI
jgi:hypothetical protein